MAGIRAVVMPLRPEPDEAPRFRIALLAQLRVRWASSPREVTPVLVKTLRRWKATVRGEIQHSSATSLLLMPWLTSWAMRSSVGVS